MSNIVLSNPLSTEQLQNLVPSAFATHAHESRSSRYTYIPTSEVIRGLADGGFLPFKAVESKFRDPSKAGFTKHLIRFRQADARPIVGDSFFEICLINSHDGSSAYQLFAGVFRLVCSNGMAVAESGIADIKVRHSGRVVEEVVQGADQIATQAPKVIDAIENWRGLELTAGEQEAFADSARVLRFGDAEGKVESPITPVQLLAPRRVDDNRNDLWHTFNRVQENATKGGLRGLTRDRNNRLRRVTTRGVNGIDQDVKLNRALWQLAERMAELKGAKAA